jgi:NitT/TauT family transport system substrate-binding protein
MMGDYPLIVNGFTFENNPESKSRLIAVAAYNIYGSGNGIVVHKDSPYYDLADLKGKLVSVPFGSAAHGMVLKALQDRGWPADAFQLVSQTPEVGSTNLQEKKIDAYADFVPFAELLPFRGFARKIFDGAETNLPTWHGVVVRTDFAEKYPEIVVAYLKAVIAANNWIRSDPKTASEKIQEWTGINKEVVYIFLGPGGNMTTDPTIKPQLIDAAVQDVKVLQNLGRMKEFDPHKWVDDRYIRQAFAELNLDYDAQLKKLENYEIAGEDSYCKKPISEPRKAGEVWIDGEGILPFSSAACTLGAYAEFKQKGKKINVAYVFDTTRGIKLFADQVFYGFASCAMWSSRCRRCCGRSRRSPGCRCRSCCGRPTRKASSSSPFSGRSSRSCSTRCTAWRRSIRCWCARRNAWARRNCRSSARCTFRHRCRAFSPASRSAWAWPGCR